MSIILKHVPIHILEQNIRNRALDPFKQIVRFNHPRWGKNQPSVWKATELVAIGRPK